jgi:hypothetical protein
MTQSKKKSLELDRKTGGLLSFELLDETDLPLNLTGYTFMLSIEDSEGNVKFRKELPESAVDGLVTFLVTAQDLGKLYSNQYEYYLQVNPSVGNSFIAFSGLLTAVGTGPSSSQSSLILPDGTIYLTSPTLLSFNTWYATTSLFRLQVSGSGVMTVDGRDLTGNILGNMDTYQSLVMDTNLWRPQVFSSNAFRLKQVLGNNLVTFLP